MQRQSGVDFQSWIDPPFAGHRIGFSEKRADLLESRLTILNAIAEKLTRQSKDDFKGRPPSLHLLEEYGAFITEQLQQTPHLSMEQLRGLLAARGVEVSHDTVWRFVRRQGLRFKKKRFWLLSRHVPILPGDGGDGLPCKAGSIPTVWSLSTKPGLKPIWRPCEDGR